MELLFVGWFYLFFPPSLSEFPPTIVEPVVVGKKIESPKEVYERVSLSYSTSTKEIGRNIIQVESGWNPNAKNPESTASGLFQFIASTWQENCQGLIFNTEDNITCGLDLIEAGAINHWDASKHLWHY